jgi:hypothetical protein
MIGAIPPLPQHTFTFGLEHYAPATHLIGPKVRPDVVAKRKICVLAGHEILAVQLVDTSLSD